MSLTPSEIQARADRARAIHAAVDRERVVRRVTKLFDLEAAEEPDEFTFPAFTACHLVGLGIGTACLGADERVA